jgi:peptidoglycan-associated lipoprotein
MKTLLRTGLLVSLAIAVALAVGCAGTKPALTDAAALAKAKADSIAKAEADAKLKEAKARADAEAARLKAEAEARLRSDADAKSKADAEARAERTFAATYFDYDKYNIREDQKAGLSDNAGRLKAKGFKATLEGHCDERGTIEYNLALGQKRADSVKGFLVKAGVGKDQLTTISYGKERPVDQGHTEAAWAKNRRVEIVVAP